MRADTTLACSWTIQGKPEPLHRCTTARTPASRFDQPSPDWQSSQALRTCNVFIMLFSYFHYIVVMVDISMLVMWNANAIIEYDRRISGLPGALLDVKYDNSSIEQSTAIALN